MASPLCWSCGDAATIASAPGGGRICSAHLVRAVAHLASRALHPPKPVMVDEGTLGRLPYGRDATLYGCHNCPASYLPGAMPAGWYYTTDGPLCPDCGQGQPSRYARRKR